MFVYKTLVFIIKISPYIGNAPIVPKYYRGSGNRNMPFLEAKLLYEAVCPSLTILLTHSES